MPPDCVPGPTVRRFRHLNTSRLLSALALLPAAALVAADPAPAGTPPRPESTRWVFSILPRAFQKNPVVDFNVITEATPAGRARPAPVAGSPQYYVLEAPGFRQIGRGASAGETPPPVGRMLEVLQRSLAASGYLPADADHPATLVLICSWGSHTSRLDLTGEDAADDNKAAIDELIERARIVGGDKFASEFVKAMADAGSAKVANFRTRTDETGTVSDIPDVRGTATAMMTQVFDPVERFRRRDVVTGQLVDDIATGVYFVIASAYDYASVRENRRQLLWRTKMSVADRGVSMTETLPALVAVAGPYFGRPMDTPEIVSQRLNREGQIEIGTPTVVGLGETAAPAPRP